jgi:tetratricopeptide (TPR) repeat protein
MKFLSIPLAVVLLSSITAADHDKPIKRPPVTLMKGMGSHHHPVSTQNAEAQKFFDQGLTLIYAFNHDEAVRSFERAAELEPKLAMAYWGIALAKGPNYNLDVDADQAKAAYAALEKARELRGGTTEPERDYIDALARRYSADPKADRKKLGVTYKEAMAELAKKYPDDLDAATLYAESAMNLRPWELWSADGKPAEGTEEIIAVLESVLRRNPSHPGANHYYIHAVEASPSPERGLASAARLKTLVPAAGHLVHMPSHIYLRVGDYAAAAEANEQAIVADQAYLKHSGAMGVYPMMYYSHNFHFLAAARAMQGRYVDAKKAADQLVAHVGPHVEKMPMLEGFMPTAMLIQVRFAKWDDILASRSPAEPLKTTRALWHFARGLAHVANRQTEGAEKERELFRALVKTIPDDAAYSDRNKAKAVLAVAEAVFDAKLAWAKKDGDVTVKHLHKAVRAEDALNYIEPADWFMPVRETLGAVLYARGQYAQAEKVFRHDLERNRRNGRSLFGLRASLSAQRKNYPARLIQQEFSAAWNDADVKLRIEDF